MNYSNPCCLLDRSASASAEFYDLFLLVFSESDSRCKDPTTPSSWCVCDVGVGYSPYEPDPSTASCSPALHPDNPSVYWTDPKNSSRGQRPLCYTHWDSNRQPSVSPQQQQMNVYYLSSNSQRAAYWICDTIKRDHLHHVWLLPWQRVPLSASCSDSTLSELEVNILFQMYWSLSCHRQ